MANLNYKRLLKGFWQLADPKMWIASTIPMTVGGALAYGNAGTFDLYWFLVSLAAVYLIEIGKNAVNEVVDYNSGVDRNVAPDKRTPFSGGKKTVVEGKLTIIEVSLIALMTLGAACVIGIYLMFFRDINIFWIGIAGVLISIFYSLPPFRLAYHGLGEIIAGVTFGPLILSGIYLVMTHTLPLSAVVVSLPIGFLIANVLWINQFPDYEADLKGNKKNWVVRLGKKRAVKGYALLYAAAYISVMAVAAVYKNPFWLLGLFSLPMAAKSVNTARKYYDNIPELTRANAATIMVYQFTGLGLVIAAIAEHYL